MVPNLRFKEPQIIPVDSLTGTRYLFWLAGPFGGPVSH